MKKNIPMPEEKFKQKIYFDLSSALRHISADGSVSGIQRVEMNIALEMHKHKDNVHICFFDMRSNQHLSCPASSLVEGISPSKELFLSKLGIYETGLFPGRYALKMVLNRSGKKRVNRFFLKIYLYLIAIFNRNLYHTYFPKAIAPAVPLEKISAFSKSDIFYILGSMLTTPELIEPCRQLKEKGGIVIQMIHDLIPLTKKEFTPDNLVQKFSQWMEQLPRYATHICCVSNYTRNEVIRVFGIEKFSSIETIPLAHEFIGFPRVIHTDRSNPTSIMAKERYVLCVGTLEIRKNGANLLRAWRKVISNFGENTPKLIFAGKIGWLLESFHQELRSDKYLNSFVSIIEKPSDSELAKLYENCLFTVFPSQYEGWGLPIGESLWFGKACITSNVSSMPEVGGDLVTYVDPSDIEQIATEIINLIVDKQKLISQEQKISETNLRSWTDVSNNIASYISRIVQKDQEINFSHQKRFTAK